MVRERRAANAAAGCEDTLVPGDAGGDWLKCIELGREGDARGMMSRGSVLPGEYIC